MQKIIVTLQREGATVIAMVVTVEDDMIETVATATAMTAIRLVAATVMAVIAMVIAMVAVTTIAVVAMAVTIAIVAIAMAVVITIAVVGTVTIVVDTATTGTLVVMIAETETAAPTAETVNHVAQQPLEIQFLVSRAIVEVATVALEQIGTRC
jgi:hypothetical protein